MIKKYLDSFLIKFAVIIVLFSVIIFPQLKLIGLYFTGLDYLLYFLFLIAVPFKGKLKYEKKVMRKIVIIGFIALISLFTSSYIKNYFLSFLGFLIILLPFVSYILFYNIDINKEDLLRVLRQIQMLLFIVSISVLVNFIFNRVNEYGSPYSITKDIGFAATLANINIIISLSLYNYKKSNHHLYIIAISFLAIILISALKSMVMSFVILVYFLSAKDINKYLKKLTYIAAISFFSIVVFSNDFIQEKIKTYFYLYITSDDSLEIARTATYFSAVNISLDHFPFGSGPGTFGSYPVLMTYNDLYHDYNLSHIWGMQEENLKDPNLPTFLLDTYWPSPLAEIGVFGVIILFWLFYYPIMKIKSLTKNYNIKNLNLFKSLKFYVFALSLVLFVENLTLSSLNQVSIIIIYFGFSGLIINFIENNLIYNK